MEEYFFKMIEHARSKGEIILYKNILSIDEEEIDKTTRLLENEYNKESLSYPFSPVVFDPHAAMWAARIFYYSCQLLLYRDQNFEDIRNLMTPYDRDITPSAILSVDLTLRFIPDLLLELKLIDDTDPFIDILEDILHTWHYSAIGYALDRMDMLDFTIIKKNQSVFQLYIDRVINRDALSLAQHPDIHNDILLQLGMYKKELWERFE